MQRRTTQCGIAKPKEAEQDVLHFRIVQMAFKRSVGVRELPLLRWSAVIDLEGGWKAFVDLNHGPAA